MMISVSAWTAQCFMVGSKESSVQTSYNFFKAATSQSGGGGCGSEISWWQYE